MSAAALLQAVASGYFGEVQRILEHNPDIEVDALDEYSYTTLIEAIWKNHKPIIELLLAHGAAVNGPVGAVCTPLQQACHSRKADIVSLLLEHGADVEATIARERNTPLTLACGSNRNLDIAQLLINAGADVNGGVGVIAPLHVAAYNGNTEAIELLIQSGVNVNRLSTDEYARVPAGSTPLHFAAAAENQQLSSLNRLLASGADPNIANARGQTPLHLTILWSSVDILTALLAAGGDPLHQDNDGRTPLQYFYYTGFFADHFNIITALVAAGDRSWECVPTPCPGLEAAMLSVWQNAPDELHELLKRLENPPQTLIELVPRMSEEMKKVVQEVLRGLHRHFAGYPHLKEDLWNSIFGLGTVSLQPSSDL